MSDMQIAPPVRFRHHIQKAISLRGLSDQVKRADGFNAKIAVFLVMVAIAAVNRQWLTPRLVQNESAAAAAGTGALGGKPGLTTTRA